MPGPASGGAQGASRGRDPVSRSLAFVVDAARSTGDIGDVIAKARRARSWRGCPARRAYLVLVGYGFATVFGKQLE